MLSKKEMALIRESINEGIAAGMAQAFAIAKDTYKATEKRLYAVPILEKKIQNDKEKVEELKNSGPQDRSTSLVRFQKGGLRVSPEDMLDAVIRNLEATIVADEYEIAVMYAAFPTGTYKDTVDAMVQAILYLMDKPRAYLGNTGDALAKESYWRRDK
ncbi:MAG: hypothetical protein LBS19_04520 [Clostridiales bacterium]|nr:hypothetical protein [Clostridiales bacterium]